MFYWILFAVMLDYVYFKVKYTTPNGPPVWYVFPFVGAAPIFCLPTFIYKRIYLWYLKYGPDVILTRAPRAVVLTKGSATKAALRNENCQSKPEVYLMTYLGWILTGKDGLVYTDGGQVEWRSHRKIDVAALYALPRREMVVKSSEVVDVFLREIQKHEGEAWDCEHELEVAKYQESANLNLGSCFEDSDIKQFVAIVANVFKKMLVVSIAINIMPRSLIPWVEGLLPKIVRPAHIARVYNEALWVLIQKKLSEKEDNRTRDFLAATLRVKKPAEAHEYLRASSFFLMIGNTHSTHHTILSALTNLALEPAIQDRLYQEIKYVLGHDELTLEHLDSMPLLKAVIMETNRLDSPFPFNLRLSTAPTDILGFPIPAGMPILMFIHAENWNPDHFPQPLSFRPERFIDDQGNYLPNPNHGIFGGGKRECPGKHINITTAGVFLSKILQHYRVEPANINAKPAERISSMFPAPSKIPYRFIRRNKDLPLPLTEPASDLSEIFREVLDRVK
ncbi:cytochrome P450 2F2-like [Galendromus occidentalis]|uniref:Cytochrome P450 2F2-like n=1 Tax=Galendromus occidentalis TaxID=34638 RepID=A0AAJ6QNJ9_9ACAR|nr:cytochrome P450 2F2-like [Galendromus occidentalis]